MTRHSGHIASQVNPPGNPKAHYRTGGPPGQDPDHVRAEVALLVLAGVERLAGPSVTRVTL